MSRHRHFRLGPSHHSSYQLPLSRQYVRRTPACQHPRMVRTPEMDRCPDCGFEYHQPRPATDGKGVTPPRFVDCGQFIHISEPRAQELSVGWDFTSEPPIELVPGETYGLDNPHQQDYEHDPYDSYGWAGF